MLRFCQYHKRKYYGLNIYRSATTSTFKNLLNNLKKDNSAGIQATEKTPTSTPSPIADSSKSKLEDGKWVSKNSSTVHRPMQFSLKEKVASSFNRAKEHQRQHSHNMWKKNDLGTGYANFNPQKTQHASSQSQDTGHQRPPVQKKNTSHRKTGAEAVQRGRAPAEHKKKEPKGSDNSTTGKAAEAADVEIDLDPEDAVENQPPSQGENRHLQKQLHLEHKRKEVGRRFIYLSDIIHFVLVGSSAAFSRNWCLEEAPATAAATTHGASLSNH